MPKKAKPVKMVEKDMTEHDLSKHQNEPKAHSSEWYRWRGTAMKCPVCGEPAQIIQVPDEDS